MNRKNLVEILELVSRALADDNLIPINQCFAFNKRTVTAYNDALAIIAPCETDEAFCVNGKVLLGLLSNSHPEEVTFKIDGQELNVKTGKSNFRLPWFPIEDFLFKTAGETQFVCNITDDFLIGLSACLGTSSKELSQSAFMGVCLMGESLYSTDGDNVTRYGKPHENGAGDLLPNIFCETLVKLGTTGTLSTNREWARAKMHKGVLIYGRLIEVDNPIDYEELIKKTMPNPTSFWETPGGLGAALSRARIIADPESAKTIIHTEKNRMHLLTETAMGEVKDSLLWVNDRPVKASVSAELMQRCISLCDVMAVFENCCCFANREKLLILTSNRGD